MKGRDSQILPDVTVVILNWNGKQWLEAFLPKIAATRYERLHIRLVDNGSTDGSVSWVEKNFPDVECVTLGRNHGFAQGNNLGIRGVSTPYIALVNTDVEVPPDWLTPLIQYLESHPDVAAVQPLLLNYPDRSRYDLGAAGGVIDILGYTFNRGRIFLHVETFQEAQYETTDRLFWVSGACMVIRKSVIDEIGLFDPKFFAHMEEVDFCWRSQRAGYRLACVAESHVYHAGGGSLSHQSPFKLYLNYRNNLLLLSKNLPVHLLVLILPIRMVLDLLSVFFWLTRTKNLGFPLSILKAHLHFLGMLPSVLKDRRSDTLPFLPWKALYGVYPRSILLDTFIRGVNVFSKLNWKP